MQSRTIDANTAEREASAFARFGNRYYPVDKTYDKRVYENTMTNYAKIVGCLFAFWICQAFHWWGVFSLGIVATDLLIWYSIACFFFTVIFLGTIIYTGSKANKIKRRHDFLIEKIAEKRAEQQEKETKAEQEKVHEQKLAKQAEKIAELRREKEAAQAAAQQTAAPAGQLPVQVQAPQGFVANI